MATTNADRLSPVACDIWTAAVEIEIIANIFSATTVRRSPASHAGYHRGLYRGTAPEPDTRIWNGRRKNLAQRSAPSGTTRARTCRDSRHGFLGDRGPCGEDRIGGTPMPCVQSLRVHPAARYRPYADGGGSEIVQPRSEKILDERLPGWALLGAYGRESL